MSENPQYEIGKLVGQSLASHGETLKALDRSVGDLRRVLGVVLSRIGVLSAAIDQVGADLDRLTKGRR